MEFTQKKEEIYKNKDKDGDVIEEMRKREAKLKEEMETQKKEIS